VVAVSLRNLFVTKKPRVRAVFFRPLANCCD
jgi:hypothetical protein